MWGVGWGDRVGGGGHVGVEWVGLKGAGTRWGGPVTVRATSSEAPLASVAGTVVVVLAPPCVTVPLEGEVERE